jgi:predicted DNA-binding protein with PD1-like motif
MEIHRLKKGDLVVDKLNLFLKNKKSGFICGIGALSEAQLKIYDLNKKKYFQKKIDGPLEIGSFSGIVAKLPDGTTAIHPHIIVGDGNFNTYCGHLEEATVSATFEFCYFEAKENVQRYFDENIGLNLIK